MSVLLSCELVESPAKKSPDEKGAYLVRVTKATLTGLRPRSHPLRRMRLRRFGVTLCVTARPKSPATMSTSTAASAVELKFESAAPSLKRP